MEVEENQEGPVLDRRSPMVSQEEQNAPPPTTCFLHPYRPDYVSLDEWGWREGGFGKRAREEEKGKKKEIPHEQEGRQ